VLLKRGGVVRAIVRFLGGTKKGTMAKEGVEVEKKKVCEKERECVRGVWRREE
jgi:hypothetical protein